MKNLAYGYFSFFVALGIALVMVSTVAYADQGLTAYPGFINITGINNGDVTRTIEIVASSNVTNISFIPRDIPSTSGNGIIPEQSIVNTKLLSELNNGSIQSVPIQFTLNNVSAGIYTGEIWFSYVPNDIIKVPVSVTVKDGAWLPLGLLGLGVVISYILFVFSSHYKRKYEIEKILIYIEARFTSDKDLENEYQYNRNDVEPPARQNPFCLEIENTINLIKDKLSISAITDADSNLTNLQNTWSNWVNNKPRILVLLDNFSTVIQQINNEEEEIWITYMANSPVIGNIPFIQNMRLGLQKNFDAIVKDDGQKTLENAIIDNRKLLTKTESACSLLHDYQRTLATKDLTRCPNNITPTPAEEFWQSLANLNDASGLDALIASINNQNSILAKCPQPPAMGLGGPFRRISKMPDLKAVPVPHGGEPTSGIWNKLNNWYARHHPDLVLGVYHTISFIVIAVILITIGFMQLYVSNPTFGANYADYAGLIIWGFLSGGSSDAIIKKFQVT
jgi:hypothetical protein